MLSFLSRIIYVGALQKYSPYGVAYHLHFTLLKKNIALNKYSITFYLYIYIYFSTHNALFFRIIFSLNFRICRSRSNWSAHNSKMLRKRERESHLYALTRTSVYISYIIYFLLILNWLEYCECRIYGCVFNVLLL